MLTMNKTIDELYLDYFNNYLTVQKFAEDYGVSYNCALSLLETIKKERDSQINQDLNA